MKIKVLIAMFLLVACAPHTEVVDILKGEKGDRGADGQNAVPCSIEQTEGGLALSCGEQTFYLSNGTNGTSGTSCSVEPTESGADITCGETTVSLTNGSDGSDGLPGQDGNDSESSSGTQSFLTSINSTCSPVAGLPAGYSAKKTGNGNGATLRVYSDSACADEVTNLSSTNELEVLNVSTVLMYQSDGNALLVLKVGN